MKKFTLAALALAGLMMMGSSSVAMAEVTDAQTSLLYWPSDLDYGEVTSGTTTADSPTPDSDGADNYIVYTDGLTILLDRDDKTYSAAKAITIDGENYTTIKLSNGATNILTAPEGKVISNLVIYSYINYDRETKGSDGRVCYWKQVGETTYTEEDATILTDYNDLEDYTENPDKVEFAIPNLSQVKFINTGEQVCFVLEVTYGVGEAVDGIADITISSDNNGARYNLQGVRVDDSYKGVVIMNGKKAVIR